MWSLCGKLQANIFTNLKNVTISRKKNFLQCVSRNILWCNFRLDIGILIPARDVKDVYAIQWVQEIKIVTMLQVNVNASPVLEEQAVMHA